MRPSTQAENDASALLPQRPRPVRPDRRGGVQDTQIEAMILCKKMRADGRGGAGVGAVDPWADGQARLQGFKSEEDRQAWMVMLDSQDEGFTNYEVHRNEVAVFGGRRAGSS